MKSPTNITEEQKQFISIINSMVGRYSIWELWKDVILTSAIAIANSIPQNYSEEREQTYLKIINKYNEKERFQFPQLFSCIVQGLENKPDSDFLGELFMELKLNSNWAGQFFTPYSLCKLTAELNNSNAIEQVKEHGWVSVNDPACGAGALLIAFANTMRVQGINYQNHVLFTAQDVDMTVGLMCYIQLSLLGCAGYIKIGDTLANPMTQQEIDSKDDSIWFTPMYYNDVWAGRRLWQRVSKIMEVPHTQTIKRVPIKFHRVPIITQEVVNK